MRCGKCGAELNEEAVFCYKCGSFVMRTPDEEKLDITDGDGRRKRNRSSFWLFFRIFAVAAVCIAGIIAAICGYTVISDNSAELERMYSPNSSVWEIMRLHEDFIPSDKINANSDYNGGEGEQ
jgi:uncharacterized membrane protein YvbJ